MRKIYILDTNILIHSAEAILNFQDNEVVLPMAVIEELDALKTLDGEKGSNAREAIRLLERFRQEGNLIEGVRLPEGGLLRIEKNYVDVELPEDLPDHKGDNRILKVCKGISRSNTDGRTILVTKDILLRIKAQALALDTQDYMTDQVPKETEGYTGRIEVFAEEEFFKEFKKKGITQDHVYQVEEDGSRRNVRLEQNQFVILKADQSNRKTQLGRYNGEKIVPLAYRKSKPFGVVPRNAGQYFMQEALMMPAEEMPLVIITGMAGTAKTFYSVAAGLEQVFHQEKKYRKILVTRPNVQFDHDIGYLPGTEQEKISPLLRPIIDNLEQLVDSDEKSRYQDEHELHDKIEELFAREIISAEAMNFIRGRSFVETYLIIDEAQNLTPKQVKGVITRAGKNTKVILLGDPNQIDTPYLDERTNGLSYAAERMKGSPLCCQLTLLSAECERSELAKDAIERM